MIRMYADGGIYHQRICVYEEEMDKYHVEVHEEAQTNNQLEYLGLLKAISLISKIRETITVSSAADMDIVMDSQLVVRQINGKYKVRNQQLMPYYEKARQALEDADIPVLSLIHI